VFSLPKKELNNFVALVENYHSARTLNQLQNIVGLALEGPTLSLVGGTPEAGCWNPTKAEWITIAKLGSKGLIYCVVSPDYSTNAGPEYPTSIFWITKTLMDHGVMPALGHILKDNPAEAARQINVMLDGLEANQNIPVITDHMFNDMPLNFKHTWRTASEQESRRQQLAAILAEEWNYETIDNCLGPVPAELVRQAWKGKLKICLNFDGDHVDIEICKKAINLIGAENILLMTDRIAGKNFGGRKLIQHPDNSLLYQDKGIVAGGTQSLISQLGKMIRSQISSKDIYQITYANPNNLIEIINRSKINGHLENA